MNLQSSNWQFTLHSGSAITILNVVVHGSSQLPLLQRQITIYLKTQHHQSQTINSAQESQSIIKINNPVYVSDNSKDILQIIKDHREQKGTTEFMIQYSKMPGRIFDKKYWWLECHSIGKYVLIKQDNVEIVEYQFFSNITDIIGYISQDNNTYFGLWTTDLNSNTIITAYKKNDINKTSILYQNESISAETQLECSYRIQNLVNRMSNSRTYQVAHSQIFIGESIFLIYNRELAVYDAIEFFENIEKFDQFFQYFSTKRLRYPRQYYRWLFQEIKKITVPIDFNIKVKLSKYCSIENIAIQNIQQEQLLSQSSLHKQLTSIPDNLLLSDPISSTILIYWLLGLPGPNQSQIYEHLQSKVEIFGARTLKFNSQFVKGNSESSTRLSTFILREDLFKYERFAYVFMESPFTEDNLDSIIELIEGSLPHSINYQICLVAPPLESAHHFYQQELQFQLSYCFPFDMLIASLIAVQQSKVSDNKYKNPTENLAESLNYISSVYCNLKTSKLIRKPLANLQLIEYSSTTSIPWQNFDSSFKEEIEDCLKILFQTNYKTVEQSDPLLWYFLQNIEQIQYEVDNESIADTILSKTFNKLPFIECLHL